MGAETVYWLRSRLRWGAEVSKNQDVSVAKAKKAGGQPEGLAELMVFFCERATGRGSDVGLQDEGWFEALVRRFRQALKAIDSVCASPARSTRSCSPRRTGSRGRSS